MKDRDDIIQLLVMNSKDMEKELGIKIRNGQAIQSIKAVCKWFIKED